MLSKRLLVLKSIWIVSSWFKHTRPFIKQRPLIKRLVIKALADAEIASQRLKRLLVAFPNMVS